MALADRGGRPLDLFPVSHVAALPLGAEWFGSCAQALLVAADQHAAPAALRQLAGGGGADPARAAGDDSYLRHTRTSCRACACAPRRSVTTARNTCRPCAVLPARQTAA